MRWPWVGRGRLDDALEQVAFLRAENARLSEALTRIGRHEAGMTEEPRAPRPVVEPMPESLKEHIAKWGSRDLRKQQTTEAYRRHVRGVPWTTIEADILAEEESQ